MCPWIRTQTGRGANMAPGPGWPVTLPALSSNSRTDPTKVPRVRAPRLTGTAGGIALTGTPHFQTLHLQPHPAAPPRDGAQR